MLHLIIPKASQSQPNQCLTATAVMLAKQIHHTLVSNPDPNFRWSKYMSATVDRPSTRLAFLACVDVCRQDALEISHILKV